MNKKIVGVSVLVFFLISIFVFVYNNSKRIIKNSIKNNDIDIYQIENPDRSEIKDIELFIDYCVSREDEDVKEYYSLKKQYDFFNKQHSIDEIDLNKLKLLLKHKNYLFTIFKSSDKEGILNIDFNKIVIFNNTVLKYMITFIKNDDYNNFIDLFEISLILNDLSIINTENRITPQRFDYNNNIFLIYADFFSLYISKHRLSGADKYRSIQFFRDIELYSVQYKDFLEHYSHYLNDIILHSYKKAGIGSSLFDFFNFGTSGLVKSISEDISKLRSSIGDYKDAVIKNEDFYRNYIRKSDIFIDLLENLNPLYKKFIEKTTINKIITGIINEERVSDPFNNGKSIKKINQSKHTIYYSIGPNEIDNKGTEDDIGFVIKQ